MINAVRLTDKIAIIEYFAEPVDNHEEPDSNYMIDFRYYIKSVKIIQDPECELEFPGGNCMRFDPSEIDFLNTEIKEIQTHPTFRDIAE